MEYMNNEMKAIIELSKITRECPPDISMDLNWSLFFKYALSNRVIPLVFANIRSNNIPINFPKYYQYIVEFINIGTSQQNKIFFDELFKFNSKCKEENIPCIPVKGAMLIPTIYKDNGIRTMGDLDFLINSTDSQKINQIMQDMGYIQGKYDKITKGIIPFSRSEQIKWKIGMSNLPPYMKFTEFKYLSIIKFDFRFSLDDSLDTTAMNEIVEYAFQFDQLKKAHVLVHLCTHLFDESKQSMNVNIGKDINLIKYVDIREYILQIMEESDLIETVDFCERHDLKKQLYFALYHLKLIYNDGYEDIYMKMLKIEDTTFLNTYGNKSTEDVHVWKKSFFERMFSGDNRDELTEMPNFFAE